MRRYRALLVAAALAACGPQPQGPAGGGAGSGKIANATPEEAVNGFYAAYLKLPVGGIPDEQGRASLAPYLTASLNRLLDDAAAAEERHRKATDNQEPPLIEGDPFSSTFEGANSYEPPQCEAPSGSRTRCAVPLRYRDASGESKWTDTSDLVKDDGAWRIHDIEYGGNWAFGNRGTLSELLKAVIADARK